MSSLVSAATSGWLLGTGAGFGLTNVRSHLLFAFGLGAALYIAIDRLMRWAVERSRTETASGAAPLLPVTAPGKAGASAADASEHARRLDAVGRATGAVLHDVNNVLTAISGHAELALRKLAPGGAARPELEGITEAVERCARLTRPLLPHQRDQLVLPQPLELNTVVLDMSRMLAPLLGDEIELVVVPGASRSTLLADLGQIERLVLNLAVNARDAMPSGGVLRILTENVERLPDPEHSDPGGLGVALIVQDTGQGMDAATRARLFEPGFSTKPAGQGTGLGLSIVQEVARQSSATIDCQTAPGRGTTVRVVFPLAHDQAAGTSAQPATSDVLGKPVRRTLDRPAEDHFPDRRNRVLVIDDDAEVRRVLSGLLEAAGFRVMTASDGAQALAMLEWRAADAVLCDIFMPNKEGIETCTELRRRYPALRVIAMSGAAGASGYLRAAEQLGAVASLHKPFTGQELVAVLQGALADRARH